MMIRSDLNITQSMLARMRFGAENATHHLTQALNDGELPPGVRGKLLTARSCVETAKRQADEAMEIVSGLKKEL